MKKVLIITSYLDGVDCLSPEGLQVDTYQEIICADAGFLQAEKLGIKPSILIGDYDSMEQPEGELLVLLPREKDMTDTEAAFDLALEKGATDICILGGLGGRFDHSLGNIGLLCKAAQKGVNAVLEDGYNRVRLLLPGTYHVERDRFTYMSLFAYAGTAEGVTLKGTKYWLHNHTLTPDTTLCVSNEIEGDTAEVSFTKGQLLLVESNDAK